MPSFSDSIFLFVLALLLFGPKKLPVLARELGKWVGEFRRASNEFKMQMEEELRVSEQEERNKRVAAMEAAAPVTPAIEEPEHPHLSSPSAGISSETPTEETQPLPIATSGELSIMPPSTGLPLQHSGTHAAIDAAVDDYHDGYTEITAPEHSSSMEAAEPENMTHAG